MYAPFGKTFHFASPVTARASPMAPEIENLLSATPRQTCMPAGTSALGHDAFKIMRNTNLMRMQQVEGEKTTQKHFRHLRDEMLGRKKAFDESVNDYKLGLVRARERKRKIQGDNSEYWHQQMDWKKDRNDAEWQH